MMTGPNMDARRRFALIVGSGIAIVGGLLLALR
jgi:hypothetical protein